MKLTIASRGREAFHNKPWALNTFLNEMKDTSLRRTFSFVLVVDVAVEAVVLVPASPAADIFAAFWALAFFRRPIVRPWVCPSLELSNALRLNHGRWNLKKTTDKLILNSTKRRHSKKSVRTRLFEPRKMTHVTAFVDICSAFEDFTPSELFSFSPMSSWHFRRLVQC